MRASATPVVSVCVPTRNRADHLATALTSALQQPVDLEVIVCDDASTDGTPQVVDRFRDPRIRYQRRRRPGGVATCRNACLQLARGAYVAWLDSDDGYLDDGLARQLHALERRPTAGMVHGGFHVVDATGVRLPDWPPPFDRDVLEPGRHAFRELIVCNYVTTSTVLMRRKVVERVGDFATNLGPTSTDWHYWLRTALTSDVAYTGAPVAFYRQHEGSMSSSAVRTGTRLRSEIAVVEDVLSRHRRLIDDVDSLGSMGRAALGVKGVLYLQDAVSAGDRVAALAALGRVVRVRRELLRRWSAWALAVAILTGAEYRLYVRAKEILGPLHREFADTRFGQRTRKHAVIDPTYLREIEELAGVIRRVVPRDARIAVVDRHDPTLLHLSRRRGWHFPDLELSPEGYPRDSQVAVQHLETLRARGARYLLIPPSALWWLEHYSGLRDHLSQEFELIFHDELGALYALSSKVDGR